VIPAQSLANHLSRAATELTSVAATIRTVEKTSEMDRDGPKETWQHGYSNARSINKTPADILSVEAAG
jgi:hypothetical protein